MNAGFEFLVNIYIFISRSTSILLSPNFTKCLLLLDSYYFDIKASMEGSIEVYELYMIIGFRILNALSSSLRKLSEPIFSCTKSYDFNIFFIHLLACSWGSIIIGFCSVLDTINALFIDTVSFGNPKFIQSAIYKLFPTTSFKSKFYEYFIYNSLSFYIILVTKLDLYAPV